MRTCCLLPALLLCASCGGRAAPDETGLFTGYLVSGCWEQTQGLPPWSPDVDPTDPRCPLDLLLVTQPSARPCEAALALPTASSLLEGPLPSPGVGPTITPVELAGRRLTVQVCAAAGKCVEGDPGCVSCEDGEVFVPSP